jgi:tetratricopeptide (TPR) repeat protein
MEWLGTAAAIAQLGEMLRRIATDGARGDAEALLLAAFERAVHDAIAELGLDPAISTENEERLRSLLMHSPDCEWMFHLEREPSADERALFNAWPNAEAMLDRFRTLLHEAVLEGARRPGSALTESAILDVALGNVSLSRQILDRLPATPPDVELARMPPPVDAILRRLTNAGDGAGRELLRIFQLGREERAATFRRLFDYPPPWLASSSIDAWEALAEHANAHGDGPTAESMWLRAAADNGPRASEFLARAALAAAGEEATDRAREHLDLAREAADAPQQLVVDLVTAALDGDPDRIRACAERGLANGAPCRALLYLLGGRAMLMIEEFEDAVALFARAVQENQRASALRIHLAQALVNRAMEPNRAGGLADLQLALGVAIEAREHRAAWGGDSAEAVEIACQAAFLLDDWDLVEKLGASVSGHGQSPHRAEIRQLVALAQLRRGAPTDATAADSEFERQWIRGLGLVRSEDRDGARSAFIDAAAAAADQRELDRALRSLANLGYIDLPRLDEVREANPDRAEALLAKAEFESGATDDGIRRLRPVAGRDRLAAFLLGHMYLDSGNPADAARCFADSGAHFSDPTLLLEAAAVLEGLGELDAAEAEAERAIPLAPIGTATRQELRRLLIQVASRRGDVRQMEATCRIARDEGDALPRVRWAHVQALAGLRRFAEAWLELSGDDAPPIESEAHAVLFLHVQARAAPGRVTDTLRVMDLFPESHDVLGLALSLFFSVDKPKVAPAAVTKMQAYLARFVELFPASPIFRQFEVAVDDPELLREQLRDMIAPDPERDKAARDLAESVAAGRVPLALAASIGTPLGIEALIAARVIPFPCVTRDPEARGREVEAATAALDGHVVVDPSSVVVGSFIRESWPTLRAAFASMAIPASAFAQLDEVRLHAAPAGSLRWDHENDTYRMDSVDEADRERIIERREWVRDRAAELTILADSSELLEELRDVVERGDWAAALTIARAEGRPLLCDDVAIVAVASSLGISTFSTYSLVAALREAGQIDESAVSDVTAALYRAQAVDLPLHHGELLELARGNGWELGPAIEPLTRPAWWVDPRAGYAAYARLLEEAAFEIAGAAAALHASTLGLTRTTLVGSVVPVAGALFAGTVFGCKVLPADVPLLVDAMRVAVQHYDAEDPLERCVEAIYETVEPLHGPAAAAAFTSSLFGELSDDDRATVTNWIVSAR